MIRNLLATTALATLIATGAYAQSATTPAPAQSPAVQESGAATVRAEGSIVTNIIGESVYNGTGDDAENIGNVSDVVFDKDGQAKSVVIDVGGFLGVGAKSVAFEYGKLQWAEKNGDRWLVAQTTKDELTAQAEFDSQPYSPAPAPAASTDATAPTAPATTDTAQKPADMNAAPAEPVKRADGNLATNIIGEDVYNGTGDDAQNIGDVNDIVLTKEGKAESLVIGVGGFLGLGAKNVTYDFSKAQWAEKNGDRWLVAQTTKEELQAQPDFDRKAYDPAPATTASNEPAATAPAAVPSDTTAPAVAPADKTAEAPAATTPDASAPDQTQTAAIDKSTLTEMPVGEIRADDLKGTTVYGANDARVGEIGDVVLAPDNKTDAVIVDVGGFLGVGEKEVAVGMDNLKFMTDKDGNKYLYTTFTKEQLEAQTAYDKGSYAEQRDQQRMIVR
ncbi:MULTISPECIES: PRC-barrel domain-containing protein [Mesorhizobium]|uniref:PRC-barrel domain-containing protein n=1 Tax=Mesorhizobium TaxID=68287 RepID=UPI000FCAE67C|nr:MULTISPECIES: PRC-barrel domain-containing protein [Mesorhizobium]RVB49380.1 PRC-barrel domain containing protein [Mesorhizobium sp. M7A.F.Ca.CA.004.05.1.1]MCF6127796.1 PRC-barrel domain-containing protein [Mesorhizobium ciceri]MCQ8815935.1 PRC-barrel domain-containing protein [Mesorhizobium sp. SEMIA396]RUX74088.1 PRC-barrel domain containing protein [Mesorhizobium sp. M7A.F.Ca.CA.004.08.2.1]RUX86801.1 PRC-barrel domain containing protein [Mesorhizobium sp. M7A.F.Ca.CA.004.08.1.1]